MTNHHADWPGLIRLAWSDNPAIGRRPETHIPESFIVASKRNSSQVAGVREVPSFAADDERRASG